MNDLATLAIDAHGGLDRWRRLKTVSARLVQGGVLWKLKGQDRVLDDVHLTLIAWGRRSQLARLLGGSK